MDENPTLSQVIFIFFGVLATGAALEYLWHHPQFLLYSPIVIIPIALLEARHHQQQRAKRHKPLSPLSARTSP